MIFTLLSFLLPFITLWVWVTTILRLITIYATYCLIKAWDRVFVSFVYCLFNKPWDWDHKVNSKQHVVHPDRGQALLPKGVDWSMKITQARRALHNVQPHKSPYLWANQQITRQSVMRLIPASSQFSTETKHCCWNCSLRINHLRWYSHPISLVCILRLWYASAVCNHNVTVALRLGIVFSWKESRQLNSNTNSTTY